MRFFSSTSREASNDVNESRTEVRPEREPSPHSSQSPDLSFPSTSRQATHDYDVSQSSTRIRPGRQPSLHSSRIPDLSSASTSRQAPYDTRQSRTWRRPEKQPSPSRRSKKEEDSRPKSKTNIYIGLSEDDSDDTLRELVKEFGPTESVKAILDDLKKCKGNL